MRKGAKSPVGGDREGFHLGSLVHERVIHAQGIRWIYHRVLRRATMAELLSFCFCDIRIREPLIGTPVDFGVFKDRPASLG